MVLYWNVFMFLKPQETIIRIVIDGWTSDEVNPRVSEVTLDNGDQEYNAGGDPDEVIRVESLGAEGSFLTLRPHVC